MKTQNTLTIIRGLPGSGKSTLAKMIASGNGAFHIEADHYFIDSDGNYNFDQKWIGSAHEWCQDTTEWALTKQSVIVSNTFTTLREMRPYFEIAFKYGILPTVILAQNDFGNIHSVPNDVMIKMKQRFCFDITQLINEYKTRIDAELVVA